MKITTRYDLGDTLYPIWKERSQVSRHCGECNRTGSIELNGRQFVCPSCRGSKEHIEYGGFRWSVDPRGGGVVGKITAFRTEGELDQTRYMLSSTGIGTGTLWDEEDVFPTRALADAECWKRNEA